jgi:putative ubiquitin-RnfH superfamily antitoxin RatB of RatAB toxin-antitoxin module
MASQQEIIANAEPETIVVEVAYALPHKQKLLSLQVPVGTTAYEAALQSGIVEYFPEIDVNSAMMGVFAQALGTKGLKLPKEYILQPRDRVEIYRPLIADPKEIRKRRAAESKLKREQGVSSPR